MQRKVDGVDRARNSFFDVGDLVRVTLVRPESRSPEKDWANGETVVRINGYCWVNGKKSTHIKGPGTEMVVADIPDLIKVLEACVKQATD